MMEPGWLLPAVIDVIHDMQLAEHGGALGVRDRGLLDSALNRPRNLLAHGEADLCALAAAYAYSIAKNHPYVEGNERTTFLAAYTFLRVNQVTLVATEISATEAVLGLSSGQLSEAGFAEWLRDNTEPTT
jgi:death-on-curing protein